MMWPRLALALAAALLTTPLPLATTCVAEHSPRRPIKIIVPFGAGGPADTTPRLPRTYRQLSLAHPLLLLEFLGFRQLGSYPNLQPCDFMQGVIGSWLIGRHLC